MTPYAEQHTWSADDFEPDESGTAVLLAVVTRLRNKGFLADNPEQSDDWLIEEMKWASARYLHLQKTIGKGGSETKAGRNEYLDQLREELFILTSSAKRVQELIGGDLYESMPRTARDVLMEVYRKDDTAPYWRPDPDLIDPEAGEPFALPDPLRFAAYRMGPKLTDVHLWADMARNVTARGRAAGAGPGKDRGSADATFARSVASIVLEIGQGVRGQLPVKTFQELLEAAYAFVGSEVPAGVLTYAENGLAEARKLSSKNMGIKTDR